MNNGSPGYFSLVPPWRQEDARELLRTRIFTVHQRRATSPTDPRKTGEFVSLQCADWCNVIALTPDRRVILIEQFRHGLGEVTLEVPGGMVDPGERPEHACARELLEETGYAARGPIEIIGVVSANPALQNNRCHIGLATDAEPAPGGHPDHLEELAVRLVPLTQIPDLIRGGIIHHSLIVAAFHYLALTGRYTA
jgi:ADP-ribose pyrophosphatase